MNKASYLIFRLLDKKYGIKVQNILYVSKINKPIDLPDSPKYIFGIMKYQNNVIPIFDMALKCGLINRCVPEAKEYTVVVMQVEIYMKKVVFGVVIDKVVDVLEFKNDDINPLTDDAKQTNISSFVSGIKVEADDDFIFIVDPDKVYTIENNYSELENFIDNNQQNADDLKKLEI